MMISSRTLWTSIYNPLRWIAPGVAVLIVLAYKSVGGIKCLELQNAWKYANGASNILKYTYYFEYYCKH